MAFDLYAWKSPRDLDPDEAMQLVQGWHDQGADPAAAPFEPSEDVGWFHRELVRDAPGIELVSDAVPNPSTAPIWLSTESEPPARVVAIRLPATTSSGVLEDILGLATKYDLVLFDPRRGRLHQPLEEMAEYASATFWPAGAIQAAVAGGAGLAIAVGAWLLSIPILSGVAIVVGAFLFVMAVLTFVHEGRKAVQRRRS